MMDQEKRNEITQDMVLKELARLPKNQSWQAAGAYTNAFIPYFEKLCFP